MNIHSFENIILIILIIHKHTGNIIIIHRFEIDYNTVNKFEMASLNSVQQQWIDSIKKDIKDYPLGTAYPQRVDPPIVYSGGRPEIDNFYLKPVVVFAPHKQYPILGEIICKCGRTVKNRGFANNPSARYVHGLDGGVYLLYFVYKCTNQSCYNGVIPLEELLTFLPAFCRTQFPVELTHKSAITKQMLLYITSDATTGKSLEEVGNLIATFRTQRFLRLKTTYYSAQQFYNERVGSSPATNVEAVSKMFSNFDEEAGYNEVLMPHQTTIVEYFK